MEFQNLDAQTAPHVVNLKDDYAKLQNATLSRKQIEVMSEWVQEKAQKEYIKIDPAYNDCTELHELIDTAVK